MSVARALDAFERILFLVEELRGRDVEAEVDLLGRTVARFLDRLEDEVQRSAFDFRIGREPAFVADRGR
jgi:hypothetical protein